jgi:hypothetical protein
MQSLLTWPVGHDDELRRPPAGPILAHVAAGTAGGVVAAVTLAGLGAALALVTGADRRTLLLAAAPLALLAAYLQLRGRVAPLPELRRQVAKHWFLWRSRTATAAAWGFVLGLGAATYLRQATAWTVAVLVALGADPLQGLVVGACYGFARGLPVVVAFAADRIGRRRPRWDRVAGDRSALPVVLAPLGLSCYALLTLTI